MPENRPGGYLLPLRADARREALWRPTRGPELSEGGALFGRQDLINGSLPAGSRYGHFNLQLRFGFGQSSDLLLIVLDVMLPGKTGFDVCRDLRQQNVLTPVLMLTARCQLVDKVVGLKLGADDYLTKPFEPLELLARIEALLQRLQPHRPEEPGDTCRFGSIVVNFRSTEVRHTDRPVDLSAREFALLRFFIEQRGATLSRRQLLVEVWGYDAETLTRTVDVHVAMLRQKLEDDQKRPRYFLTVRGLGYKFVDTSSDAGADR